MNLLSLAEIWQSDSNIMRTSDLKSISSLGQPGETAFEAAFAQGQKMSLDEALDLAQKTVEEM